MKAIIKDIGDFSKSYKYIHTNTDDYLLIKKTAISGIDEKNLIGNAVPDRFLMLRPNKFEFKIHFLSVLIYLISCLIITLFFLLFMKNSRIIFLLILLWTSNFHELGHFLAALGIGCKKIWVGFDFKYHIFPIAYVSNREAYSKTKKQRIFYFSAGILANLVIILLALLFQKLFRVDNFPIKSIISLNVSFIVVNLYPFLFTDGFNILKEVTEYYDVVKVIFRNKFNLRRLYGVRKFYFFYSIFTVASFFTLIIFLLSKLITFFS
jgi:hypothetical protein